MATRPRENRKYQNQTTYFLRPEIIRLDFLLMKVTIVIPLFNKEEHVRMAVRSALEQTHPEVEVIVVNDGSTDNSASTVNLLETEHENLTVLHQTNQGLSVARNNGLKHGTGEYVLFHDADDKLERNAVERLLHIALTKSSDIVGGIFRRHSPTKIKVLQTFARNEYQMRFSSNIELALKYCVNFSSCNKLFKVSFLQENQIRFTPGLYMQDIEFWLKCMVHASNVSQTDIVVAAYYYYPNSGSQAKHTERFESLFLLSDRLSLIFQSSDFAHLAVIRSHALIQGAIRFFSDWKLDEWETTKEKKDLDRIGGILRSIPEEHFVSFLERNRGPTTAIQLLIRVGDYQEAYRLKKSPYSGSIAWRKPFGRLDSVEKIMGFSRGVGRSFLRNLIYEIYYLVPLYWKNPERIPRAGVRLLTRLIKRIFHFVK